MPSDPTLIQTLPVGDREAFSQLVGRYQNYLCSIAYAWTGDIGRSEDLTQQTFLIAWKNLEQLSDPEKILPWLRGILRNLWRNEYRKRSKETTLHDLAQNEQTDIAAQTPLQKSISREESDILWNILEQIPELYREPLILYYREEKSVANVAHLMNLSEDAVKQRLARGRKLVKAEIETFVEETLFETRPDNHFAAGVIAALPAASGKLTGSTIVASGTAAGVSKGLFWSLAGPLIGLVGAYYGCRASLKSATSAVEKRFIKRAILAAIVWVTAFALITLSIPFLVPWLATQVGFWVTAVAVYVTVLWIAVTWTNRRLAEIKKRHGTPAEQAGTPPPPAQPVSIKALRWNAVGSVAGSMSVVPILATLAHDWVGLLLFLIVLTSLISWLWQRAPRCTSRATQIRFNAYFLLATAWTMAIFLLIRWDHWLAAINYPDPISGLRLAILSAGFGSLLCWYLLREAARIEKTGSQNQSPG